MALRVTSALFGWAFPLLMHAAVLNMGGAPISALLAGCLAMFDMLNVIESRLILVDSQLMFYLALSLVVALKFWKRVTVRSSSACATRLYSRADMQDSKGSACTLSLLWGERAMCG